jgi:capsular exopolysaccharide synthesis family protein
MQKSNQMSVNIEFKRLLFRALSRWYLFAGFLILGVLWAYYVNRYTTRIYPISASILFFAKDETSSGAELLYRNALLSTKRNYLNDTYIMKSELIIKKVVEELSINIQLFLDGDIASSEIYDSAPIEVKCKDTNSYGEYSLVILDKKSFTLDFFKVDVNRNTKKSFSFGDSISFDEKQFAIQFLNTDNSSFYIGKPIRVVLQPISSIANNYADGLVLRWAEEGSGVMNMSMLGPTPSKDINFINSLIKNYQRYDLDNKNRTADRTVDFIKVQLDMISDSLRQFEAQLERFKQDKHTNGDFNSDAQRMFARSEVFENQKSTLLLRNSYYNYLQEYLSNGQNLEQVILPTSLEINDPILSGLLSKIIDMQFETKMYVENNKRSSNPLIDNKIQRINELKKEIKESMKNQLNLDKIKVDFLDSQIKAIDKLFESIPFNQRKLVSITRKYSLYETLYLFLLQKKAEGEISRSGNTSDLVVINPPRVIGGSTTPSIFQNYLIGIIVGLLIPFLIVLILEILNNKVVEMQDISSVTQIPIIGGIGHKVGEGNLQVFKDTRSAITESFRALRSNLSYFTKSNRCSVFLVTSSISGEGKTFTSINLASILSLSGKKTLLVGADLRRPKLFSDFNVSNNLGLSSLLAGISSFEESIQQTEHKNLDIIVGGPIPPNPSELLMGDSCREFIDRVRNIYDFVIIDSAPMSLVTDSYSLLQHSDHVVFVVRQKYTPKVLLRSIDEFYTSKKINNISILFNDLYSGLGSELTDGYSYTYGYKTYNSKYYN